jgi:hypothetical protein
MLKFIIAIALSATAAFATDLIFSGESQVFAQVVDGSSWKTTITLLNLGSNTATYGLNFYGDDGKPLSFDTSIGPASVFAGTIPPHGTLIIATAGTKASLSQGWALLAPGPDSTVSGSAIFRARSAGQPDLEAAVPGDDGFFSVNTFPFDHTGSGTGLALVNQFSFTPAVVSILIRDQAGNQIVLDSLTLQPHAHQAITLNTRYPQTVGRVGSVEVSTTGLGVNVLGLRYSGATFTSITAIGSF